MENCSKIIPIVDKYFKQRKDIKQSLTETIEKVGFYFCVIFDLNYESFISWQEVRY